MGISSSKFWENKQILITGSASFIGSRLCERLVDLKAKVTAIDNLSTGKLEYIKHLINKPNFIFIKDDIRKIYHSFKNKDIVFHLAAVHGGREFISKYPADCCQSLEINEYVFRVCVRQEVRKVVFSSSVCVYPLEMQLQPHEPLKEIDALRDGWAKPDTMYGWAKLTAEKSLMAYKKQYGLKSAILRYTTVYGPRENDTHAIVALIKRALNKEDPFVVWGSGDQKRDWIYVDDVVSGTILAAEKMNEPLAINLVGTEPISIKELTEKIFNIIGWHPKKIIYDITKPEGPRFRSISGQVARIRLGFIPATTFDEGLRKTIEWLKL